MVLYKDDILYVDQTSKMKMILTTEPLKWKFGLNIPLQCVHIANPRLLPVAWSSLFKNDNQNIPLMAIQFPEWQQGNY